MFYSRIFVLIVLAAFGVLSRKLPDDKDYVPVAWWCVLEEVGLNQSLCEGEERGGECVRVCVR